MDEDSDIVMGDAPEPSPRPSGAHLSGAPQTLPALFRGSNQSSYYRVNPPAAGNLGRSSFLLNTTRPFGQPSGFTTSQMTKSRPTILGPVSRGPNFFSTPKGSTASFKNPKLRGLPFSTPYKVQKRLSPSDYRRPFKPWLATLTPEKRAEMNIQGAASYRCNARVFIAESQLQQAEAALTPEMKATTAFKRSLEEREESATKRARIFQEAIAPSTPARCPVQRMPGAFPESPEHTHTPLENQPLSLPSVQIAAAKNIALAGLSIYARVRRITGVVRGAHRAFKQGIKTSTQFATAVGQRIRTIHETILPAVEERRETQQIDDVALSSASDQLQNDLTASAGAMPPHHLSTPIADPSAQLQAELDSASPLSALSNIVTTIVPSIISANLPAEDQASVQEDIMSEPSDPLSEAPAATPTTTVTTVSEVAMTTPPTTIQSSSSSLEVEARVDGNEGDDEEVDEDVALYRRQIRECFNQPGDFRPLPTFTRRRREFMRRLHARLDNAPPVEMTRPPGARFPLVARQNHEISQASTSVSADARPAVETQEVIVIDDDDDQEQQAEQRAEEQEAEQQQAEEQQAAAQQAEEQQPEEQAEEPTTDENDDRVRGSDERAREAADAPLRNYLASWQALKVEQEKQTKSALRSILKHRYKENKAQLDEKIRDAVSQLAATTVSDSVPEAPAPTRHVHWVDEDAEIPFSVVPHKGAWFYRDWPPSHLVRGVEPLDREGFEAHQRERRLEEERWEREQRESIIQERHRALGRVDVPQGEDVVRPLTPQWERQLATAKRSSPSHVLAKTAIADLTHEKLQTCWTPEAWLNDEVINSHLRYTVDYLRRRANNLGPNDAPKYFAFNSFFYKNLRSGGYQKVSRWAARAKIGGSALLNVETVFIPVHEGMHWTLLVVSPRLRTIEYFDSLGGNADSFVENARLWLKGELGSAYNESEWLFLNTPSPLQDNGSDCGVFLLTSAKAIALGFKPTVYGPRDIDLIRNKIVAELMNGGLLGDLDPRGSSGEVRL